MQHNVTLWRVRETIFEADTQQLLSYVTVNNIRILSVAQQYFYGEFISSAAINSFISFVV
jgi:hypothetical protein